MQCNVMRGVLCGCAVRVFVCVSVFGEREALGVWTHVCAVYMLRERAEHSGGKCAYWAVGKGRGFQPGFVSAALEHDCSGTARVGRG